MNKIKYFLLFVTAIILTASPIFSFASDGSESEDDFVIDSEETEIIIIPDDPVNGYIEEGHYYVYVGNLYPVGNFDEEIDYLIGAMSRGEIDEEWAMGNVYGISAHIYSKTGYEKFFNAGYLLGYIEEIISLGGLPSDYKWEPKQSPSDEGDSTGSSEGNTEKDESTNKEDDTKDNNSDNENNNNESAHEHKYTTEVTKEPTCKEEGEAVLTCECGDSRTEKMATIDHVYESEVTKAEDCEKEGILTYTCVFCNDTYTAEIPAWGHEPGEWQVTREAGKFEKGTESRICRICGKAVEEKEIPETYAPASTVIAVAVGTTAAVGGAGAGVYVGVKKGVFKTLLDKIKK